MIDKETIDAINNAGKELSLDLPKFYGKITLNYFNGKYVNSNVEITTKPDNLDKGAKPC